MLRFACCAIVALIGLPAVAQTLDGPFAGAATSVASSGPPIALSPTVSGVEVSNALASAGRDTAQASLGYDMCLDAYQGLPAEGENGGRLLILWRCHGRENQNVVLRDGVLYIGGDQVNRIQPMAAPEEGCDWRETPSRQRGYQVGVCREDAAAETFVADYQQPGQARIASVASPGVPTLMRGTPLVAVPIAPGEPAPMAWEYDPRTKHLRVVGTNLCLTPPSGDSSEGAPLYLDQCDAPFQLANARSNDGTRRARVAFNLFWR